MACLTPCKHCKNRKGRGLPVFHLQTKANYQCLQKHSAVRGDFRLEEESKPDKEGKGISLKCSPGEKAVKGTKTELFSSIYSFILKSMYHILLCPRHCAGYWHTAEDKIYKGFALKELKLQQGITLGLCTYKFIHPQTPIDAYSCSTIQRSDWQEGGKSMKGSGRRILQTKAMRKVQWSWVVISRLGQTPFCRPGKGFGI